MDGFEQFIWKLLDIYTADLGKTDIAFPARIQALSDLLVNSIGQDSVRKQLWADAIKPFVQSWLEERGDGR